MEKRVEKKAWLPVLAFLGVLLCSMIMRTEVKADILQDGGVYYFATALNDNMVIDIAGAGIADETNAQLYINNGTSAQKFKIVSVGSGWYKIVNVNSNKVLDVAGGQAGNSVNIQLYTWNKSAAQCFTFEQVGSYYYIKNKLGYYIDVAGAGTANGTNIQTYMKNGTKAQKWLLKKDSSASYANIPENTYLIQSAVGSNMVMDISGAGTADGVNLQLYSSNGTNAQKFKISSIGSGWAKITNVNSGKVLDVAGGENKSQANIQQYSWNNTNAQYFQFVPVMDGSGYYYLKNRLGYYVDVQSASANNGTNIWTYSYNGSNAQKWKLLKTSVNNYISSANPSTNSSGMYMVNGVNIGYSVGSYFTDNGRACTDHGIKGIHSYTNEKACNCICTYNGKSLGAVQCYGFAHYVQSKLYGVNEYDSPGRYYKLSNAYVAAGNLTAAKAKSIISRAQVGAHLRTNASSHSMIITAITDTGFSIIQCNGVNNKEYGSYCACRIGTYTYTWNSYATSTYGKRGIAFIMMAS